MIWKSSPAILNTLLTIINERIYRDGNIDIQVPLKGIVCVSNKFPPDNQGLEALYDRMVICYCVKPIELKQNFTNLITGAIPESSITQTFSLKDYEDIATRAKQIKFSNDALMAIHMLKQALSDYKDFANTYNIDLPQEEAIDQDKESSQSPTLDSKDLYISNRRWKQCAELLQVAAVLSDRESVEKHDVALLKHCLWNTEIAKVFVDKVFETIFHTQANAKVANAQTQLETLEQKIASELYQKNGSMKKDADTARINHYRILFDTKQARIANPFLSKEDIQSYLTTYTKDLTTINNVAIKAKQILDTLTQGKELEAFGHLLTI